VHDRPLRRRSAAVLTGVALFFLGLAALFCSGTPDGPPVVPWWSGLTYLGMVPAVVSALLAGVVSALLAGVGRGAGLPADRSAGRPVHRPTGPPAEPPAADVRLSRSAFVYVTQQSTPGQRNLIEAAIGRVIAAGPGNFAYDPLGPEFRAAYCGGAALDPAAGRTLPYLFSVGLSSPGAFPALVAEVQGLPGVVAVRHALPDE
jgi:hypothetical protein